MPGPGVSKAIESLQFLNDPEAPTYGIEMSRALYAEIPGDRYKFVKKFIKGSSEIQAMLD